MTTTQAQTLIGKRAMVFYNTLTFEVIIKDTKQAYGRTLYLIEPVSGCGTTWVYSIALDVFSEAFDS